MQRWRMRQDDHVGNLIKELTGNGSDGSGNTDASVHVSSS